MTPLYHSAQPIPATSGIYKITCTTTGKFYIGSAINMYLRWQKHRNALLHNSHHNPKLQHAWNKYGPDVFVCETLEYVLPLSLTAREQYWLDKLKPFGKKGFNLAPVAGSSFSGLKHTPETREQMRLAAMEHPVSTNVRERLRVVRLGTKASPATIEKLHTMRLGHPVSAKTRAKLIERNTKRRKTLIVTSPDGTEYFVHGIVEFCKEHNLAHSSIMQVAKGKQKQHRGWTARFPETDVG